MIRLRSFWSFIIISLVFCFFSIPITGQESKFSINSARNSSIGGPHAALTDQFSTLFNNAAGYRGIKSDFTVSEMTFKLSGPVSTMILAAQGGDIQEILGQLGSTNIGVGLLGPISIGKIDKDIAWGVYNMLEVDVFIPSLTQDAEIKARFDLGGVFGYSFGIDFLNSDNRLDFGFLVKLFFRSESQIAKSFTDIMDAMTDISLLISPDSIPLGFGFGVGLDLGMKYVWKDTISVGIAMRDIYTGLFMFNYDSLTTMAGGGSPQFGYSTLSADYSLGIMYTPGVSLLNGLLGNIKIMLDYNDIFDFALNPEFKRHILLHFGLGVEFTFFDILAIRMGLNEGLPAAGLGLDLHFLKFNFAMFGSELSTQPGLMSVYNLMVSIEFSY